MPDGDDRNAAAGAFAGGHRYAGGLAAAAPGEGI